MFYRVVRIYGTISIPDYLRWEITQLLSPVTTELLNEVIDIAPGRCVVCVKSDGPSEALIAADKLIVKYYEECNRKCQHN